MASAVPGDGFPSLPVPSPTLQALGVQATETACGAGVRSWRGIYMPSFHRTCALTLQVARTGRAELSVAWLNSAPSNPTAAARKHFSALLTGAQTSALVSALSALQAETLGDVPLSGLNGISLEGLTCDAEGHQHRFLAWSPDEKSPRHQQYFLALIKAALGTAIEEEGAFALENLLEYLSRELLVRDLGGTPRVVRLFGAYSIDHQGPLRKFFAGIPPGDVIVDARNFGGAGTALKPEFAGFDRRQGRVLWVMSERSGKFAVESLGISRQHVVSTMDEARRRLR